MPEEEKKFYEQCKRLEREAEICKHAHFEAATLKERSHLWLGLPVVIINIFIGSVLFTVLDQYSQYVGPALSLIAALLAGLQTYLNLNRKISLHRTVANQYSDIGRDVRHVMSREQDGVIELNKGWEEIGFLKEKYSHVNKISEDAPLDQKSLNTGVAVAERINNS